MSFTFKRSAEAKQRADSATAQKEAAKAKPKLPAEPTTPTSSSPPPADILSQEMAPSDAFVPASLDQLNEVRQSIVNGEEPDPKVLAHAIQSLVTRRARDAGKATAKATRAPRQPKKKGVAVDLDDLLTTPVA